MKKITLLLFFVLFSTSIVAQNKDSKDADKLFERYEYAQALQSYLSLINKGSSDNYLYKQLGNCYFNMDNTIEAEKWFALALKSNQDAETHYKYAQVLKSNAKYEESNVQMKRFVLMVPNDKRAILFKNNPDYLAKLLSKEKLFELNKLNINSDKSDFGAALFGSTLYFSSARNINNAIYGRSNEPFLDIYEANFNADGTYSDPVLVEELNSKYHEGPVAVTKDGKTIYFSSESFKDKLFEKDKDSKLNFGQVNLYKAVKENGKWVGITSLPFNSKSYSISNPSIDKEGKVLYFSSNMPGSIGGIDIWKVNINSDGTFGSPENMGPSINTVEDESFPFITGDNILYFSSKGLVGFGGLDVFSVDLNKGGEPENVGKPVNSEKDDFGFSFNVEKNIGYLSSNRSGVDHIYSAIPICKSQLLTIVRDSKVRNFIANSKVVILNEKNLVLEEQSTDEKGVFLFNAECQKTYMIEIYKDGFITNKTTATTNSNDVVTVDVILEPIDIVVTETEIILKPIYFENNSSSITSSGAIELDKLVYVMTQNNKLRFFVKSHSDSRGTDKYNLDLSEKRAMSTVQYVISKGISSDRISGRGYGESELKIDCKDNCSEEDRALNRRSEFMIIK